MKKEEIINQINKYLKDNNIKISVTEKSEIKSLGLDSLDLMDLVIVLEEKLNFKLPDEKLLEIKTIEDLIKIILESK